MAKNIYIVGGGLFGCIAAAAASANGHNVTVFDSGKSMSGSPAAGCLFAPRWASGIPKGEYADAVKLLNELYGVKNLSFTNTQTGIRFDLQHVNPQHILGFRREPVGVSSVGDGWLLTEQGKQYKGIVLVAAGIWSSALIPEMPRIRALVGASLMFKKQLPQNKMKVWAPYRQMLAFNISDEAVWFGDGTAIKMENFNDDHLRKTWARAKEFCGDKTFTTTVGARPYVEGYGNGYFSRVFSKTWVSTGGAKNGTLLAALQAKRFIEEARL